MGLRPQTVMADVQTAGQCHQWHSSRQWEVELTEEGVDIRIVMRSVTGIEDGACDQGGDGEVDEMYTAGVAHFQ